MNKIFLIIIGVIGICLLYLLFSNIKNSISPNQFPSPTEIILYTPTTIPTPTLTCYVNQNYWYCWNTGNPLPHHLGHPVYGDHLCTTCELK